MRAFGHAAAGFYSLYFFSPIFGFAEHLRQSLQVFIPVFVVRQQSRKPASSFLGDKAQPVGVSVTLPVPVGRSDKMNTGSLGIVAKQSIGVWRPATTGADIKCLRGVSGLQSLDGGKAQGVNGGLRDAKPFSVGCTKMKQPLRPAGRKAAPLRPPFFPACDQSAVVFVRRPDTAKWTFANTVLSNRGTKNGLRYASRSVEIAPCR